MIASNEIPANRRVDFDTTVNAMALALPEASSSEPVLIDPFDGAVDLAMGRLRTPLAPEVSFNDDPLRMMRAARFLAGYGLMPEPALVAAVKAVGTVLVIALIVVPGATARLLTDRLGRMIVMAGVIAAVCGWGGLATSYDIPLHPGGGVAAGASGGGGPTGAVRGRLP